MDTTNLAGLREYYQIHKLILKQAHDRFESQLADDAQSILAQYSEGEDISHRDVLTLHHVELQCTLTLRYAMLPRYLGLTERVAKGICKIYDEPAYNKTDWRDGWLKVAVGILGDKGFNTSGIKRELADLRHLIAIRDCIVHANGEVNASKSPGRVKSAVRDIDDVDILDDGFLVLGEQVIRTAQSAMSGLFLHLFAFVGFPLDHHRYF